MSTVPVLNTREYYLDWIRVSVVLILIPFHAAVSFSHIGKGYVYTDTPVDSWLFIYISDFFNLWIMRLLFFVSGISAYMALRRRSLKAFAVERVKRLIVPVLFLIFTIGPLSGYILALSRDNFSGTLLSFYPQFFIQPQRYLFWGHMWYCVYLFIFSIVLLPLFSFLLKRPVHVNRINRFLERKNNILLPMIVICLFEVFLRPHYPGYQSFIGDWANVAVHSSFFILGFIIAQSPEVFNVITRKIKIFLLPAIIITVIYLILKRFPFKEEIYNKSVILSFLWGGAAYTWVFSIIGLGRKYWNRNNRLLKYLANTSFSLYLFHYCILSIFNYFLIKTGLEHHAVWICTILGTYIFFVVLFELILKRLKAMRFICGIRR